jgi:hypothetical protein
VVAEDRRLRVHTVVATTVCAETGDHDAVRNPVHP